MRSRIVAISLSFNDDTFAVSVHQLEAEKLTCHSKSIGREEVFF